MSVFKTSDLETIKRSDFKVLSDFKILKTYPINHSGTSSEYIRIVKCPECSLEFAQHVQEGCFHCDIDPDFCPSCNYPLRRKVITEFNPSKR
jgi:hypothetical protein